MGLRAFAPVPNRVQQLRIEACKASQVLGVYLVGLALALEYMSLSLRALATSTSWPHPFKSRLTQGEWVPVSMAMRSEGSEAKRRL